MLVSFQTVCKDLYMAAASGSNDDVKGWGHRSGAWKPWEEVDRLHRGPAGKPWSRLTVANKMPEEVLPPEMLQQEIAVCYRQELWDSI